MTWQQDLAKASKGGVTKSEVRQLNKEYGGATWSDIVNKAEDKGYTLNWRSTPTPSTVTAYNTTNQSTGGVDWTSLYQNLQTGQENLAKIQGEYSLAATQAGANASVAAAGLRAEADKEVARAYADAQRYSSELGLEGVKYGADKESEWRQAVANIEVKGKLDLQPIINAGLEQVANIEAQAQRDVAETTGKYGLESMKTRTEADKSLGKMQLAGGMYGLIGSVFG